MSIEFLDNIKEIQSSLIYYLEKVNNVDIHYKYLIKLFYNFQIWDNPFEFKLLLHLICSISNNYHRTPGFFTKIDRILHFFKEDIKTYFSNTTIFNIFKSNKRILLFLIEDKILIIDKSIALKLTKGKYKEAKYDEYFSIEINSALSGENDPPNNLKLPKNFKRKRVTGENDEKISFLIQNDLVEEFISLINNKRISLKSKINRSIYETNLFLLDKEPNLIEYASFFGSIQIFQYLQLNKVKLTPSLWIYSIHGKNADIIHILEDNHVKPEDETYEKCLEEAVKCHHNSIATYIQDNFLDYKNTDNLLSEKVAYSCFYSFNFHYFPSDFCNKIVLYSREFHKAMKKNKKEIIYLLLSFLEIDIDSNLAQISIDVSQAGKDIFDGNIKLVHLLKDPYISKSRPSEKNSLLHKCSSLDHLLISTSIVSSKDSSKNDEDSNKFKEEVEEISSKVSITSIGTNLFKGCSKLTQITIPPSVTLIDERSFEGCSSLVQVSIPRSVELIGDSAFYGCSSLAQITIPNSVTTVEPFTFFGCSSLKEIKIPSTVTKIGDSSFRGCSSVSQIIIPNSVSIIEQYAFYGCTSLTEMSIPSSVTKIGDCAFKRCSSLTSITIPSFLTKIESYTFYGCSSLTDITIPSSVTKIGLFAFRGCLALKEIVIPSSVKLIESNAFFVCTSLAKISIPDSITSIESFTFSGCSSLKEVTIPSSVTRIQDDAFFKCASLTQISIPDSVTSIESYSFYGCLALKEISIPSSVKKIGNSAFRGCSSLVSIELPSSVESIEDHLFYECTALKNVIIPSSVTLIEHHSFYGCSSLIEIKIPISVKKIGDDSFIRCPSLRKIYVPGNVNIDKIGIEFDVIVKKI